MLIFDSIAELEVRIRDSPPDHLLVMGPFLDVNHPLVASGTLADSFGRPITFEDVYREEVVPKLARLARACDNAKTQLYILPSTNEARNFFPIPQPPIDKVESEVWRSLVKELPQVKFVSNPATIQIGDLKIFATSADALSAINSNVLFKADATSAGRVETCLDQILRSRSLFPVMPNNLRIDPSTRHLADLHDESKWFPHIIVSPSLAGKRFIKKVSGRVFVNPGFMSDSAGTTSSLAEIVIAVPGGEPNDVCGRVSGDLVKL
jgi:DNA polymerase alpha subunit B